MVKLVDTGDSESPALIRRVGSNPTTRTIITKKTKIHTYLPHSIKKFKALKADTIEYTINQVNQRGEKAKK